jgi:hypothetical protein
LSGIYGVVYALTDVPVDCSGTLKVNFGEQRPVSPRFAVYPGSMGSRVRLGFNF